METWIRSAIVLLALAVVGVLGDWQASALISSRGSLGPTILQSNSPISSLSAVLVIVGAASLIGGYVGRLTSTTTGMFILGFALFAMALKLNGAEELILSHGSFNLLIIESALLSAIVLLGAIIVFGIAGPLKCVQKQTSEDRLPIQLGKAVLISLAIIPVIWLIAITPDKGQVIGAAAVGGIVIGMLSRQFLGSMQPLLLFALPTAMGGVGYYIGVTLGGTDPSSFAQQEMSTLLFPMPLDYAAGAIIGLSLGLSWTASTEDENVLVTSVGNQG